MLKGRYLLLVAATSEDDTVVVKAHDRNDSCNQNVLIMISFFIFFDSLYTSRI